METEIMKKIAGKKFVKIVFSKKGNNKKAVKHVNGAAFNC
jgi:hypothetical protein